MKTQANHNARSAGRGGIAVLAAKAFFILSGLIQQTLLPRLIGLDGYGALARVFAITSIANNVVISSSIQGVSHSIAHTPDEFTNHTLRRTFRTHLAIAIPIALLFFFFAPVYASFQGAPHIIRPLQILSLVVLFYGLYAPLVGALNGMRRFTMQAGLDITYAVLRTAGLLGLGWFFARGGHGVVGACPVEFDADPGMRRQAARPAPCRMPVAVVGAGQSRADNGDGGIGRNGHA